jgi:hypothetical protein
MDLFANTPTVPDLPAENPEGAVNAEITCYQSLFVNLTIAFRFILNLVIRL